MVSDPARPPGRALSRARDALDSHMSQASSTSTSHHYSRPAAPAARRGNLPETPDSEGPMHSPRKPPGCVRVTTVAAPAASADEVDSDLVIRNVRGCAVMLNEYNR